MKKLALKLDQLAVESFIIDPAGEVRGTVAGHNPPEPTVSCGGTCDNPCGSGMFTCDYTCPASCWGTCQSCGETCQFCSGHASCPPID